MRVDRTMRHWSVILLEQWHLVFTVLDLELLAAREVVLFDKNQCLSRIEIEINRITQTIFICHAKTETSRW